MTTAGAPAAVVEVHDARSGNLDALRAAAALYVLAGHAYLLSGSAIGFRDRHPVRLAVNTGGSGVWLFFALSGYLIAAPSVSSLLTGDPLPDVRAYARRRTWRIFPAYWLAFAAILLFGLPVATVVSVKQVAVHAALLHNLVPGEQQAVFFASWTLTLEVLFYASVPIGAWLVRRWRRGPIAPGVLMAGVLAAWAASVAFVALAPLVSHGSTTLWLRILFPSMLSMFCPGILVAIAVHQHRVGAAPRWFTLIARRRRASIAVLAALAVAGALGATAVSLLVYDASRQLFALASGIALVLALTRPSLGRRAAVLTWLGMVSYGIYLWQGVIIYVLERHELLIPMHHTGAVSYVVHVALLLVLTLPFAWASWHLVERPAIKASRSG